MLMICVTQDSGISRHSSATDGWSAFAATQLPENAVTGYVSQVAHARLAGQIAAALHEGMFGELPGSIIDIIATHDVGWSELDLPQLEQVSGKWPDSFLRVPPRCAIGAWHRSIAAAEKVSPMAAYLTRKHFCLLAPRDEDSAHRDFIEEQEHCLNAESVPNCSGFDLSRFVAALGFCDLLSLHLCSGSIRPVRIPLAHPAEPIARSANEVTISTMDDRVFIDMERAWKPTRIDIGGWLRGPGNRLTSTTYAWTLA